MMEASKLPEPMKSVALKKELVVKELTSEELNAAAQELKRVGAFNDQSEDEESDIKRIVNTSVTVYHSEMREENKKEAIITESNAKDMINLASKGNLTVRLSFEHAIICELPSDIEKLTNLKELTLVNSGVRVLPNSISKLVNLRYLDLSGSAINTLPDAIGGLRSLDYLNVSKTMLRSLPDSICMLECLEYLDGSDALIAKIPMNIGRLRSLLTLNLSKNKIGQLPYSIGGLKRLQVIDLSDNNLTEMPETLSNITELQILDISGNKRLKRLPRSIGKLAALKKLDIRHTSIERLPDSFCHLTNLQVLNASGCTDLSELPSEIGNLKQLRELYLDGTSIKKLPPSMTNLENLSVLGLSGTSITLLPDYFNNLRKLEILDLSYSKLTRLPDQLNGLTSLRIIDLRHSYLYRLPDEIGELIVLTRLYLGATRLEYLNVNIGRLHELQILDLSSTKIRSLPDSICNLKKLVSLYIEDTLLDNLPENLGSLNNLGILSLSNSRIKELPESIANLSNLHVLDLSETGIEKLPGCIFCLPSIERIGLCNLTVDEIPEEITQFRYEINNSDSVLTHISKGVFIKGITLKKQPVSIFNQTKELIAEYFSYDRMPVNETKVVFLGDGSVGKSYAIQRLENNYEEFNDDGEHYQTSETVGIDISVKEIVKADNSYKIHYWDFAGQKMYESMHRCFLTNRTCYVVVIKPRETNIVENALYWIRNISTFAPNAPILVFMNLFDSEQDPGFPIGSIKKEYPNVIELVTVNAMHSSKEMFEKLGKAIQRMVESTDSNTLSLPKPWDDLRRDLLKEKNRDVPYIRYKTYVEKCRRHGINDPEIQMWLLEWFNDLGECFSFANSNNRGLLGTLKVLDPEWLHNGIYRIIHESKTYTITGRITHSAIETLLGGEKRGLKYQPYECKYLLEVMRRFGLSYNIEEVDEEFIPAIIKNAEPQEEGPSDYNKKINYGIEYKKLLPENVIQKLMVNHYDGLLTGHCWKGGFWYCIKSILMTVYIYLKDGNELRIAVYSQSEIEPWNVLQELLKEIREINHLFNLTTEEFVYDKDIKAPILQLLGSYLDKSIYMRAHTGGYKHHIEPLLESVFGKQNLANAMQIYNYENRKFISEYDTSESMGRDALEKDGDNNDAETLMSILRDNMQTVGVPVKKHEESSYAYAFNTLCELIKNGFRQQFGANEIPPDELSIQERMRAFFDAKDYQSGYDYIREAGDVYINGRKSRPDFIFPVINTALEVKYSKDTAARQRIIGEINADWGYLIKYDNVIFVVYDLGTIVDVNGFQNSFVDSFKKYFRLKSNVRVIVIKN